MKILKYGLLTILIALVFMLILVPFGSRMPETRSGDCGWCVPIPYWVIVPFLSLFIFKELMNSEYSVIVGLLLSFTSYFIIGLIIGFIIEKIKSKKLK